MTMAILALLAWKAMKHFGGGQPGAAPAQAPAKLPGNVTAGLPGGGAGGGLSDLMKGGLGGLRAGHIVTTGSVCGVLPVTGPGRYTAEIEGLGTVDLVVEPA